MKKYLIVDSHHGDIAVQTAEADESGLIEYIKRKLNAWYINKNIHSDVHILSDRLPANLNSDFFEKDRNTSVKYIKSDDMFIVKFDQINIESDDPDISLEIVPMEYIPNLDIDK